MKKNILLFTTFFLILLSVACDKNTQSTNDNCIIDIQIGALGHSTSSDICGDDALIGSRQYNSNSGIASFNIEVYDGQKLKIKYKCDNIIIFKTVGNIKDPTKTITYPITVKGLKTGTGKELLIALTIENRCNNEIIGIKHKTSTVPGDPPFSSNMQ